jgi:hypothetical protein
MKTRQTHDLLNACTAPRESYPKLRSRLVITVLLMLSGLSGSPLNGQGNPSIVDTGLSVSEEGEVSRFWRVLKAGVREELAGTTGYVKIQNVSDTPIEDPIFYGEYYDSSGRFCFSLILSQDKSQGEQGVIAPGESSVVGSTAVGLFPISQPKEVRLFLVQLSLPDKQQIRKWDVPIRAPVTLLGGFERDLRLPSETASAKKGILDLILANVTVDKEGIVTTLDVVHAASAQVESWFRDFVKQATFYPATNRDQPQDGRALLLVRAVTGEGDFRELVPPPQLSPWVNSYAESGQDSTASPVTNILLGRPAPRKNKLTATGEVLTVDSPPSPPGLFQLAYQDTYWSSPAVRLVRDDSMPHHIRREVTVPQPH